jgi:hypothetical protein
MLTVVLDCTTTSKIASYLDTSTAIAFGSDARGVIDHADSTGFGTEFSMPD